MSDDPLALSASASDDRRRPVPSFPNAVVDEPRGRPPDAAAERLDGRAAASGDRAAETVEIGAARATGNPPRRPVRNPYLKSNSSNNRSRPTANNSRPTNFTRPSSSIARSTTNNARSASANNNTGQDASQASTTGANQTPAAPARVYSDRWPKHALNFFKRVSDEIDAAVKYKYHPKGSTFRGKWPRAYWSGIVKPWEDPLAFVGMGVDSRSRDTQTDVTMMAMPTQPAGKALANTKDGATTGHIAKRAGRRCRTCGKVIKDWNNFHIVPLGPTIPGERGSIRYLNLKHRAHEHCTVPPNQREPRFPLAPGAKFPKKRKKG